MLLLPSTVLGHPLPNSHIPGPTFDEQQHRNSEVLTVQRAVQACQQIKSGMPWSAGHSGNKHQEWPCSCQGRAGSREVPWERRMVMEKEGALLPLQEKAIKLANPTSFHLLVSPARLRSLYEITQGAADVHPSLPVLSGRAMSSSG